MTGASYRPRFAVCDACGRNRHKVAIRLAPDMVAKWSRHGHPVYGLCPSCFAGSLEDGVFPARIGTVIYDLRRRKP